MHDQLFKEEALHHVDHALHPHTQEALHHAITMVIVRQALVQNRLQDTRDQDISHQVETRHIVQDAVKGHTKIKVGQLHVNYVIPDMFRDGCVRCNPGEVSSFELTKGVCISCWELHFGFRSSNNQSACIPCDQGMMSYDAKSCTVCSPGFYWNPKLKTCPIECPKGNFCTPARVPERNETYCSTCTACKPGSFQPNDGQYGCVLCPAGTFQDTWGSTVCKPCSKGYVQTEKGAVSCIPCPGGYYCPNSDTMKPCPKGKYCPSESTQPQTCAMMFDARPDHCKMTTQLIAVIICSGIAFVGIIAIFIYRWQKSRHREIVEKELLVKAKKRRKDPVYLGL
eukprot:gene5547-173_t